MGRHVAAVAAGALSLLAAACTPGSNSPVPNRPVVAAHPADPAAAPPSQARHRPRLIRWHGPVEGIFVHPLVLRPGLAFTADPLGVGFQHFFVTGYEFRRILRGLWRHGWTLVDPHRAANGHVRVPAGRTPLVLSEDDVNYYAYFRGRGLASRLVLNDDGEVRAEVRGRHGRHLTMTDVVPLVDAFVQRHPEFSADGAKGLLAVTAYEGLFGEHHLRRPAARARVRALVARLRATGWTIASHTYGHIDLSRDSLATIARDTRRWKQVASPLLGPTDVLVYPFGARPTDAGVTLLRRAGFRIQIDIDVVPHRFRRDGATIMSRLHVDWYAFDAPRRMAPLFSVRRVRDPARPR